MKQQDVTGRLARWVWKLQGYKFTISHRKGKDHVVPDALSRIPFEEVAALDLAEPEIDLCSPHFNDIDYLDLKRKISDNPSKYPDIKVIDDYVYIRTSYYTGDNEQDNESWKLWIPLNLRNDILSRFHNSPVAAHGGMVKTLELIRRKFYWPGMVRDVRNYVRLCETCKECKAPNSILKPNMGAQIVTFRPFQRLYVDILGPYPRSKQGHIGILIVLDHMSKFHWLCPLKKFTASIIQKYLLEHIFHVYGVPETLVSDNGSQFKANEFNAFLTEMGIKHVYTAIYSPQSNASERVNRSIISGIRSYLKKDQTLWDKNLSFISCALRNAFHQTIQGSPYQAVFGQEMVTHGSSYNLLRNLNVFNEPCVKLSRDDKLQLIRNDIQKHIDRAFEKNRSQYNLRTRPISYDVGQTVYRRNFAQSNLEKKFNSKLAPTFLKSKIKEKIGNHYYILDDDNGKILGTYHAKDLRI